MATGGKANKAIVLKLVEYINYFADSVKEDSAKMLAIARDIKSNWNDPQYEKFIRFMEEFTQDLVKDTQSLYDCAYQVKEHEINRLRL